MVNSEPAVLISGIRSHLETKILPFWENLKDDAFGGYYGYMDEALHLNRKSDKGCILNSRILWFFSTAARVLKRSDLCEYANRAWRFMSRFEDPVNGGLFWSVTREGKPADTTKHTYCQAFALYGIAAWYRLTGNREALQVAMDLFRLMENRCRDSLGYLEAQAADFTPVINSKLSENGVIAARTMNTLLHVVEAYAELYRAHPDSRIRAAGAAALRQLLDTVYDPEKRRMNVFFDFRFHSLLDMQSYGHDIEASWLLWDAAETLLPEEGREPWKNMCLDLLCSATERAFTDHGLHYEMVNGSLNTVRAWWPQAEAMLGFEFGWRMTRDPAWISRIRTQWAYICGHTVDPREGSEWFNELREDGTLIDEKPMVEEWKCPYHNGRMCLRLLKADLPEA
jgi:mannobiose 2-epimerase